MISIKPNIAKLLIIANLTIFVVSIGIVYYRIISTYTTPKEKPKHPENQNITVQKNILYEENITKESENGQKSIETLTESTIIQKPHLRRPMFSFYSTKAKKVSLIGDFNNWIPQPMIKKSPNKWELVIEVPSGRYLYNFLVDGKVITDPNNKKPPEISSQGFKSSVLDLTEK